MQLMSTIRAKYLNTIIYFLSFFDSHTNEAIERALVHEWFGAIKYSQQFYTKKISNTFIWIDIIGGENETVIVEHK